MELHNVKAEAVNYQGRATVRVKDVAGTDVDDAGRLAIIPGTSLQDGARVWQWIKVRIQASGTSARPYGAAQPVLIVNDLKQLPVKGAIALWVGPGTMAHFSGLKVSQ